MTEPTNYLTPASSATSVPSATQPQPSSVTPTSDTFPASAPEHDCDQEYENEYENDCEHAYDRDPKNLNFTPPTNPPSRPAPSPAFPSASSPPEPLPSPQGFTNTLEAAWASVDTPQRQRIATNLNWLESKLAGAEIHARLAAYKVHLEFALEGYDDAALDTWHGHALAAMADVCVAVGAHEHADEVAGWVVVMGAGFRRAVRASGSDAFARFPVLEGARFDLAGVVGRVKRTQKNNNARSSSSLATESTSSLVYAGDWNGSNKHSTQYNEYFRGSPDGCAPETQLPDIQSLNLAALDENAADQPMSDSDSSEDRPVHAEGSILAWAMGAVEAKDAP